MTRDRITLMDILGPLVLGFGLGMALLAWAVGDPVATGPASVAFVSCLAGLALTAAGWTASDRREIRQAVEDRAVLGRVGGPLGRRPNAPTRRAA